MQWKTAVQHRIDHGCVPLARLHIARDGIKKE
jgi:hypothetical protein